VAQVAQHLPSNHEALSSICSTTKEGKNKIGIQEVRWPHKRSDSFSSSPDPSCSSVPNP
jgi:hypothetical protein